MRLKYILISTKIALLWSLLHNGAAFSCETLPAQEKEVRIGCEKLKPAPLKTEKKRTKSKNMFTQQLSLQELAVQVNEINLSNQEKRPQLVNLTVYPAEVSHDKTKLPTFYKSKVLCPTTLDTSTIRSLLQNEPTLIEINHQNVMATLVDESSVPEDLFYSNATQIRAALYQTCPSKGMKIQQKSETGQYCLYDAASDLIAGALLNVCFKSAS